MPGHLCDFAGWDPDGVSVMAASWSLGISRLGSGGGFM